MRSPESRVRRSGGGGCTPNVGGRRYGASMAKSVTGFRCTECGWQAPKWTGRCGECQAWGTVEEMAPSRLVRAGIRAAGYGGASSGRGQRGPGALGGGPVSTPAIPIGEVDAGAASARPTGLDELDRVLG